MREDREKEEREREEKKSGGERDREKEKRERERDRKKKREGGCFVEHQYFRLVCIEKNPGKFGENRFWRG